MCISDYLLHPLDTLQATISDVADTWTLAVKWLLSCSLSCCFLCTRAYRTFFSFMCEILTIRASACCTYARIKHQRTVSFILAQLQYGYIFTMKFSLPTVALQAIKSGFFAIPVASQSLCPFSETWIVSQRRFIAMWLPCEELEETDLEGASVFRRYTDLNWSRRTAVNIFITIHRSMVPPCRSIPVSLTFKGRMME